MGNVKTTFYTALMLLAIPALITCSDRESPSAAARSLPIDVTPALELLEGYDGGSRGEYYEWVLYSSSGDFNIAVPDSAKWIEADSPKALIEALSVSKIVRSRLGSPVDAKAWFVRWDVGITQYAVSKLETAHGTFILIQEYK